MDKMQIISLVLGSAAIGALVSAALTALSQWRERVARQKELLLSKSIDMAQKTTELMLKIGKPGDKFFPEIVTARWYHRQLTTLFSHGKIDENLEREFADFIHRSHSELDKEDEERRSRM